MDARTHKAALDRREFIASLRALAAALEQDDRIKLYDLRPSDGLRIMVDAPPEVLAPDLDAVTVERRENERVWVTRHVGPWAELWDGYGAEEWDQHVRNVSAPPAVACVSHRFGSSAA